MAINWEDKTTVKKGNIGERIVRDWLISRGYIPYKPEPNGAHPFDNLVASRDKKTIFVAETKSKPARVRYPDTGIDERHYADYCNIREKYNMDTFIFFVDEDRKAVYGNWLRILETPRTIAIPWRGSTEYPLHQAGIIYFPLEAMSQIGILNDADAEHLRQLSTRNQIYAESVNDCDW